MGHKSTDHKGKKMKLLEVVTIKSLCPSKNNAGSEKARHRMGRMDTCVYVYKISYIEGT